MNHPLLASGFQILLFVIVAALIAGLVFLILRKSQQEKKKEAELLRLFRSRNDFQSKDELYWYTAREVVSRLGFSDCVIYELDYEKKICVQTAASGPKSPTGNKILNPIQMQFGKGIVGSVAVSGKAERIGMATSDPRYIPDDDVRCSELTVPVLINGKVIAIIDSEEKPVNHFRPRDQEMLEQVAQILSDKLAALN